MIAAAMEQEDAAKPPEETSASTNGAADDTGASGAEEEKEKEGNGERRGLYDLQTRKNFQRLLDVSLFVCLSCVGDWVGAFAWGFFPILMLRSSEWLLVRPRHFSCWC